MKNLTKLVAAAILAASSTVATAAFSISDLSTAGYFIQNQLNDGFAATADSNDYIKGNIYPINIESNGSFVATVLVTIEAGNVALIRCNAEKINLSTELGITCDGTFTVKSGFFSDWARLGFAAANANVNQRHIEAILNVEGSKAYTIFAGDVYIKAGKEIVSVSLNSLKGKTAKQIETLIMSELSGTDAKDISRRLEQELLTAIEDAKEAAKVVTQVSNELEKGSDAWFAQIAAKVESDCVGIGGSFSEQAKGSWSCSGGTHPE